MGVAMIKEIGGILIALTEPPHQRMIGRLCLGMVSGFLIRVLVNVPRHRLDPRQIRSRIAIRCPPRSRRIRL